MRALASLVAGTCARAAVSAAGLASAFMAATGWGRELVVAVVLLMIWAGTAIVAFVVLAGIGTAAGVIEQPAPAKKESPDV